MLLLVFQLGSDRYAIDAAGIVEVLPLLNWKRVPHSAPGIAGLFDYHGVPVPLIDLAEMSIGMPSRKWMSTRIIIASYSAAARPAQMLGLIAEQATEVIRRSAEDFVETGLDCARAPYLGPVLPGTGGIVQRIEIEKLLSDDVRRQLFAEAVVANF